MHDILEGIAPLEIKLFLRILYNVRHFFFFSYLNDRLMNFNFGYSEQDKPVPILTAVIRSDEKKYGHPLHKCWCLLEFYHFLWEVKFQKMKIIGYVYSFEKNT